MILAQRHGSLLWLYAVRILDSDYNHSNEEGLGLACYFFAVWYIVPLQTRGFGIGIIYAGLAGVLASGRRCFPLLSLV